MARRARCKRVLVRLRAGVAEEHPGTGHRAPAGRARAARRSRCCERHRRRIEEQRLRLSRDGRDDVRVAVPGGRHGVSAVGVEPLVALGVDQPGATAADGPHRHLGVDGEQRVGVSARPSAWIHPREPESRRLLESQRQVHRLDGLAGRSLDQVVDRHAHLELACRPRSRSRGSARRWCRPTWVSSGGVARSRARRAGPA